MSGAARMPIEIPVRAFLQDHRFGGRAVLPAVEAMALLAGAAAGFDPAAAVFDMAALRFDKFLDLPPVGEKLAAFCDLRRLDGGDLEAALVTRAAAGRSALARVKVHASLVFRRGPAPDPVPPAPDCAQAGRLAVPGEKIYPELIPFGPCYRNVVELNLGPCGAEAVIKTPVAGESAPEPPRLGSPFALDAAFHAACVWSQRFYGIVAFPVAIDRRRILLPTRPGGIYRARAAAMGAEEGVLVFDVAVADAEGRRVYEACSGVRMRDVSGGRLKPPAWIRHNAASASP